MRKLVLKNFKRNSTFLILWLVATLPLFAQDWELVRKIDIGKMISSFSKDSEGRIYLGTKEGDLYRYLCTGNEDMHFSEIANSTITSVEARNRLKVFLFYRDLQRISILDRFTTKPVSYEVSDFESDFAWLITPGIDNSLWILSTAYNELRKYNIQTKQLISNNPLSFDLNNVHQILAHQNLLILSDKKKGIYFFDQYGSFVSQLKLDGLKHFQVENEMLLLLTANNLIKTSLSNPSVILKKVNTPEVNFVGLLLIENFYCFIKDTQVHIYHYKPL